MNNAVSDSERYTAFGARLFRKPGASGLLVWVSMVVSVVLAGFPATAQAQGAGNFYEDFDSYANGSQIAGQGNWIYWANTNVADNGGAFVTNTPALSGANSLEVGAVGGIGSTTNSDVCWQFTSITNGVWTFRAMVNVPANSTNGQQVINLMASHPATPDRAADMSLDLDTGLVDGGPAQIVRDQWTEVRMEARVDDLEYDIYYDDLPVELNGTWDGPNQIEAIDLWADNGTNGSATGVSPIYFDDLSMERMYINNADGATNVTGTSATLNGELMLAVAATTTVTVYWGPTDEGTDAGAWTSSISLGMQSVGPLATNITGLAEDTTYYYRFFASGGGRDEWAHETASFLTLTAPSPTNDAHSFLANGSARLRGRFTDQNRGDVTFYWGDTNGVFDPGGWGYSTSIGSQASATFSADVSGLLFPNTYYYTCYATNAYGDAWADPSMSFVTPDPETSDFSTVDIGNSVPTDVTTNSATLNGTFSSTASIYDIWVHWGTVDQTTNANLWANSAFLGTYTNEPGRGLSHTVTGLDTGSTNYFAFHASNALYSAWAAPSAEFLTVDGPPAVNNVAAVPGVISATLGGELTAGNAADVTIFWGRADGGTNASAWDSAIPLADLVHGAFSAEVEVGYGVTYHFRCYAANAAGEGWAGSSESFEAQLPLPRTELTPGVDFAVDAGLDTDGDQYWEDLVPGNPSGLGLMLDDSPAVNRVAAVTGTQLTHAYDFPGESVNNEAGALLVRTDSPTVASFQHAPGDWSNDPVSLEVWFKPDNLTPTPGNGQILFEDGGGTGVGLFIDNNELVVSHDSNQGQISYNLSTDPSNLLFAAATSDFIQAVVTHDTAAPNLTQFFINGRLVGTSNDDGDWSGGDAAAFGTRGQNNTGGRGNGQANTQSFDGQIALIRLYNGQILTEPQAMDNYHSVDYDYIQMGITNLLVSDVLENTATLNGSLSATGWVFDVTVYWGATNGGTVAGNWEHEMSLGSYTNYAGDLSYAASGLMANSGYFYTFSATNAVTNLWAAPSQYFETLGMPVVSNAAPTDVTQTSATLNGELVSGGTGEATIYWGLADGGATPGGWEHTNTVGTVVDTISATVPVIAGGTYHYRCYVTNAVDDDWSDLAETFTAPLAQVTLGLAATMPDLGLDPTSGIPGCIFWIAADDIDGDGDTGDNPTNGAPVNVWADKSGLGHDVARTGQVDPSLNTSGPNGRPVVAFDSDRDYMATTYNFDPHTEYTILSVARYTGGASTRVISSATRNWLFGFHGNGVWEWHAEGWIYNGVRSDTAWHIHAGHINDAADPQASFWVDGERLVVDDVGSGNGGHMIGQLGLGGYRDNQEESDCEIAEILVYDRVLTAEELNKVGSYLDNKYKLNTAYAPVTESRGTVTATATLSAPAISNVTVNLGFAVPDPPGLLHKGFHEQNTDNYLDLNNNGGLMRLAPYGTAVLTDGPAGRGLDFNNDADFQATGAISQPDYYANLFIGYFHAPVTGPYLFRNAGDDDRGGIWLDLDQDGIFESSTPGLGSDRGEQLSWEDGGAKEVELTSGERYMVAFTHREGTGGSRCDFRMRVVYGPEMIIKPSDPAQAGWWTYMGASATHGSDYTSVASVMIPAGSVSTNFTVTPIDDLEQEEDETVLLSIDSVVNAVIGTPGDATFVLSSEDPEVVNSAPMNVADGSATIGGTLTMGDEASARVYWGATDGDTDPSQWGATIVVNYAAEDVPFSFDLTGLEAGKTYYYRCYATNDSNLGEDWADATSSFVTEGTSVSIDDIAVVEGNSGSASAVFTVSLSAPSTGGVTVGYATLNGDATVAGGDYTATNGTVSIPAGQVSTQLTVMVNGDRLAEGISESFTVELSNATGASLGDASGTCTIEDDDADVYLRGFTHRMPITFSGYAGGETLTNWPALLRISEANIPGFTYASLASATGGDLRFASSDGTRLLSFEIESWTPAGESAVWVRVPELAGTDTRIWAYWGNPNETTLPTYATDGSTWDETFAAVYHLTSACDDSTANANHAPVNAGTPSNAAQNVIGQAYDFNGSSRFRAPDAPSLDLVDGCTLSGWFNARALTQWQGMIAKGNDSAYELEFGRGNNNCRIRINNAGGDGDKAQINGWSANTWYYIVGTYDMQNTRLYRDGVLGDTRPLTAAINQNNEGLTIGARHNNNMNGMLDEWRVSNVPRSDDWILASYENQKTNSTFVTPGGIESRPVITIADGATNITQTSAYATATLTSTGTAETTVWVHWGETDGGQTAGNWANTRSMGTVTQAPPVAYTTNLVGLTSGVEYFYAYSASNSLGESWASSQFYTLGAPIVENTPATPHVGYATLNGNLLSTGGAPTTVFTYWGETDEGTSAAAWDHVITNGLSPEGAFSADTTAGLVYGQVYHYRSMATNSNGGAWADTGSTFTTAYPVPPEAIELAIYREATAGDDVPIAPNALECDWDTTVRVEGDAHALQADNKSIACAAGHHLVMYSAYLDRTTSGNRSEVQGQLRLNGTDLPIGWSQLYTRWDGGNEEAILSGGGIVEVANDDDLLLLRAFRTDNNGAGTMVRWPDASGIQLLKLGDSWDYCRLHRSVDQAGPNSAAWVPVQYDTQDELDTGSFAHDTAVSPQNITLKTAGHYLVLANTYDFCSQDRTILKQRLVLDGVQIEGSLTTVYIRGNQNSCSEGAASIGMIIETTGPDQVLTVEGALDVNRSASTYMANKCAISIVKLPDNGAYVRLGDSGADDFNPAATTALGWDTELELDADGFTHNDSQIAAAADDDYLFMCALYDNDDAVQRGCYWQRWRTDGNTILPYGHAGRYARNTGGADSCGNWSGILLDMTAGSYVETVSEQLGAAGALTADNKGLQGVQLSSIAPVPKSIANLAASDVTATSATFNASVLASNAIYDVRVYWGETDGGSDAGQWTSSALLGTLTDVATNVDHSVSGLTPGAVYYYTFRITNPAHDTWASPAVMIELPGPPVISDGWAGTIAAPTADLKGRFLTHTRGDVTICFGLTDGGTGSVDDWDHSVVLGAQTEADFSSVVSPVYHGQTYAFRCYATNAHGDDWSENATTFSVELAPPRIPLEGLLGMWTFDDGTCNDVSGNGHDGLNSGGVFSGDVAPGATGQSIDLNGDKYVLVDTGGNQDVFDVDRLTVSCWVKEWPDGAWEPYVGKRAETDGWDLRRFSRNYAVDGDVNLTMRGTSGDDAFPHSGTSINADQQWHHLAATYDGSVAKLYFDNQVIAQELHTGDVNDTGSMLVFGARDNSGGGLPSLSHFSSTKLDDVVIYDRGLTAEEIGELYAHHTTPPVANDPPTDMTLSSMQANATMTLSGGIYDLWVYWGPTDGADSPAAWASNAFLGTVTNYVGSMSHVAPIMPGMTNHYTFRATNMYADTWGTPSIIVDPVAEPAINNDAGALTAIGSATLQGDLTAGGYADVFVYWGRSDGETNAAAWDSVVAMADTPEGAFDTDVSAGHGVTYHYRCYATNASGDVWASNTASFETPAPIVGTPDVPVTGGLLAHWDAASLTVPDGSQVDAWENSVNPGTYDLARMGGSPTYLESVAGLNGEPAVFFNPGTEDWFEFDDINTIRTVFWVLRDARVNAEHQFMLGDDNVFHFHNIGTAIWNNNAHANVRGGSTELNGAVIDGLTTDRPTDFAVISVVTTNGPVEASRVSRDRNINGRSWEGEIAEILLYDQALSAADEDEVGSYLSWRYGLSTAYPEWYTLDIANSPVSNVSTDSATMNGMLDADGWTFDIYACWGTNDEGTVIGDWDSSVMIGSTTNYAGVLTYGITGLERGTDYFCTFIATNGATNLPAVPSLAFQTMDEPTITNLPPTDVMASSATLNGSFVGGMGEVTIYWGLSDGGESHGAWGNTNALGAVSAGPFSTNVSLLAGGQYYYRCYVTNALGEDWGNPAAVFMSAAAGITVADASITEGDTGQADMVFGVTLSDVSASNVTVNFATGGGSAAAGVDYAATNGMLTFPSGSTSTQMAVTVYGDRLGEYPSETFAVTLSNAVNAAIADDTGIGTIVDDDFDNSLPKWKARMKITFSGYTGTETLTNFPALVVLNEGTPDFYYDHFASPQGLDLRFSDATGVKELNYETEHWDTSGDSFVWVQVPELVSSNTFIWAYWANPAATYAPAYTTNGATWTEGFAGVWHMTETDVIDSTPNSRDGMAAGAPTVQTGNIGDAVNFAEGNGDEVTITGYKGITGTNARTMSAWIKTTDIDAAIMSWGTDASGQKWIFRTQSGNGPVDGNLRVEVNGGYDVGTNVVADGQWHHVVAAFPEDGTPNPEDMLFYVDGEFDPSSAVNSNVAINTASGFDVRIGQDHSNRRFNGLIDEARICPGVRSADWIRACYSNQVSGSSFAMFSNVRAPKGTLLIVR